MIMKEHGDQIVKVSSKLLVSDVTIGYYYVSGVGYCGEVCY